MNDRLQKELAKIPGRVQRGKKFFAKYYPGYYRHINTLDFDMSKRGKCVCGQLFGDYHKSPKIVRDKAVSIGVWHPDFMDGRNEILSAYYNRLTDEWRMMLQESQGQGDN